MDGQTALDGVNVLDLSESVGGAYCTKLLADHDLVSVGIKTTDESRAEFGLPSLCLSKLRTSGLE